MSAIQSFVGLRSVASKSENAFTARRAVSASSRSSLQVVATKKVIKKVKVVLTKNLENVGESGDLCTVPMGFFRNFLLPQGLATWATEGVLEEIKAKDASDEAARQAVKAKAQMLATALTTIGKFTVKKTVGDDKKKLFGSVTAADVVEAVKLQTDQDLDTRTIEMDDQIREVGTYAIVVKLHPEVLAKFSLIVIGVRS
eukprot:CAMPEP_0198212500 /NCGR_PEP_ID=MMETSP1445-20131203/26377_1 /TAXON_ID=36898 /ORGANISM="Pyramimonas sp., Strain CCMP2087" /LENGTH=198 /DNA_ID=CAMNT_0043886957 /DNA_START=82 /DNA_END=678 /DNA_ORIENTATION=+